MTFHYASFDTKGVNPKEAPEGFYAVSKNAVPQYKNLCCFCDARSLCQANEDHWTLRNRCMSSEVIALKDGKTYGRKDGKSVVFKRLPVAASG